MNYKNKSNPKFKPYCKKIHKSKSKMIKYSENRKMLMIYKKTYKLKPLNSNEICKPNKNNGNRSLNNKKESLKSSKKKKTNCNNSSKIRELSKKK
jgi:hypothetical protein